MSQSLFYTYCNFNSYWSFKELVDIKRRLREANILQIESELYKFVSNRRHFIVNEDQKIVNNYTK